MHYTGMLSCSVRGARLGWGWGSDYTWTCSTMGPPIPSPDVLKLVHYVSNTSISKQAVGLGLKGLLVDNQHSVIIVPFTMSRFM